MVRESAQSAPPQRCREAAQWRVERVLHRLYKERVEFHSEPGGSRSPLLRGESRGAHTCPAPARQGLSAPRCASQTSFHPPTHSSNRLSLPSSRRYRASSWDRVRQIRDGRPAGIGVGNGVGHPNQRSKTWSAVAASSGTGRGPEWTQRCAHSPRQPTPQAMDTVRSSAERRGRWRLGTDAPGDGHGPL